MSLHFPKLLSPSVTTALGDSHNQNRMGTWDLPGKGLCRGHPKVSKLGVGLKEFSGLCGQVPGAGNEKHADTVATGERRHSVWSQNEPESRRFLLRAERDADQKVDLGVCAVGDPGLGLW